MDIPCMKSSGTTRCNALENRRDVFGIAGGGVEYMILVDTMCYASNLELTQTGPPPVAEARISMNNSVPPFQVTEIVLGLASEGLASVPAPEPSSWIPFTIGGMLLTVGNWEDKYPHVRWR